MHKKLPSVAGVFIFLLIIFFTWIIFVSARTFIFVQEAKILKNQIIPYSQDGDGARILIIGDSAAYGTGATTANESIAGLLGSYFTEAKIINKAESGNQTAHLVDNLQDYISEDYNLIIVIAGANDIIHPAVDLAQSEENLKIIYEVASKRADQVIALTTGDFGHISFFPFPLNYYFGNRSRLLRHAALEASSHLSNVSYIDAFRDIKPHQIRMLESRDRLHFNDFGHYYWFKKILASITSI